MEDEISSIIAYALAISDERHHLIDLKFENGMDYSKGEYAKAIEKSFSFLSESSFSSSPWSSTSSEEAYHLCLHFHLMTFLVMIAHLYCPQCIQK